MRLGEFKQQCVNLPKFLIVQRLVVDKFKGTKMTLLEEAQALEEKIIESGIKSGKSFRVENAVTPYYLYKNIGKRVCLIWGDLVEVENSYFDENGISCSEIKIVHEFETYLVHKKVQISFDCFLNPSPAQAIKDFIQEAKLILI